MKQKTQTILLVLALVFSIIAFGVSVGPKITGHVVNREDIYYNDGYVGIGENDPKYQLDVDGNARFQDDLKVLENLSVSDSIFVENKIGIGTDESAIPLYIKSDDPDIFLDMNNGSASSMVELKLGIAGDDRARLLWDKNTNDLILVFDRGATGEGNFIIKKHGTVVMSIDNNGQVTIPSLAGTGDTDVVVNENGTLSRSFVEFEWGFT